MKSYLKLLFAVTLIAQVAFSLNFTAENNHSIDLDQIVACKDCE